MCAASITVGFTYLIIFIKVIDLTQVHTLMSRTVLFCSSGYTLQYSIRNPNVPQ